MIFRKNLKKHHVEDFFLGLKAWNFSFLHVSFSFLFKTSSLLRPPLSLTRQGKVMTTQFKLQLGLFRLLSAEKGCTLFPSRHQQLDSPKIQTPHIQPLCKHPSLHLSYYGLSLLISTKIPLLSRFYYYFDY